MWNTKRSAFLFLAFATTCQSFTALSVLFAKPSQRSITYFGRSNENDPPPHDEPERSGTSVIPSSLLERSSWDFDRRPRRLDKLPSDEQPEEDTPGVPRQTIFPNNDWGIHDATGGAGATTPHPVNNTLRRKKKAKVQTRASLSPSMQGTPVVPNFPCTLDQVADAAVKAIQTSVHRKDCQGRLSLEIDGVQHLQRDDPLPGRGGGTAGTLRRLALAVAQRLAVDPTTRDQNNHDDDDDHEGKDARTTNQQRPVVVYLNTIKQTMLAAYEFQRLIRTSGGNVPQNVTILTVGDDLPDLALETARQRARGRAQVHPSRGFVVVVQPTDYNDEHQPPGPSIGTIEALQRLSARASLMGLTTILISPRFLASPQFQSTMVSSWRQADGTRQVAASFGGQEPARQPIPWLLRDFHPPILSWIGHGVSLSPPSTANEFEEAPLRRYTRVALFQYGTKGAWHVFGARQTRERSSSQVTYDYWASTAGTSGRPTRNVMRQIYEEFHD